MSHIDVRVCAVVVAAGKGTRMNMDINKQYAILLDKPMLAWTISAFEQCDAVSEIVIVTGKEEIEYCQTNVIEKYMFTKVSAIVGGGTTRQESVYNGLCAVSDGSDVVLIHDGARPFIDDDLIARCISGVVDFDACAAAVPVKDTIKRVDCSGFVMETPNREELWAVQTPQAFRFGLVMKAHRQALKDGFTGTDDAMLVERLGVPLKLVQGSYSNFKITTPEDIIAGEAQLKNMLQAK